MTDKIIKCSDCEDTGKLTAWRLEEGNYVPDGERDCSCVVEAIEQARADEKIHDIP